MSDRGEVRPDLVRAPRLEPHPHQRHAARASPPPRSECARRASRARRRRGARARGSRGRAARRSSPSASAGCRGSARGTSRSTRRSLIASERARCASSVRATIMRPEVSLSRRWTMPGRSGSSPPPRSSPSTSTSVSPRCPGAAWTTRPGGLVDDGQVIVAMDDLRPLAASAGATLGVPSALSSGSGAGEGDQRERRRRRA